MGVAVLRIGALLALASLANALCHHGTLRGEGRFAVCECDYGWAGRSCNECVHEVINEQTNTLRYVATQGDAYRNKESCQWQLIGHGPNRTLTLDLGAIFTECIYDHINVYDGNSYHSPRVASLSGSPTPRLLTLQNGGALIHFTSDLSSVRRGYNISFLWGDCPNDCSGYGTCQQGTCVCARGWKGPSCSQPWCPNNCTSNGVCSEAQKQCVCNTGFTGEDCSVSTGTSRWETIFGNDYDFTYRPSISQRTGHTAAVLGDVMYVFGGLADGFIPSNDMLTFRFADNSWAEIPGNGPVPSPRSAHSMVAIPDGRLLIFGGMLADGAPSNELWEFNTKLRLFKKLPSAPAAISQHTAHYRAEDKSMVVVHGYGSNLGFLGAIMVFDIETNTWESMFEGQSGGGNLGSHVSVLSNQMGAIIVNGGLKPRSMLAADPTNQSAVYLWTSNQWATIHPPTNNGIFPPRLFMHSASLIGSLMYIFGGNGYYPDNTLEGARRCHTNNFYALDLVKGTWSDLSGGVQNLPRRRYGHTMVAYNGSLYVHGGFDGMIRGDVVAFRPGNCASTTNAQSCASIGCYWCDSNGGTCMTPSQSESCAPPKEALSFDSNAPAEQPKTCDSVYNCFSCQKLPPCFWDDTISLANSSTKCVQRTNQTGSSKCPAVCNQHTTCDTCLGNNYGECIWCQGKGSCVPLNNFQEEVPYGGCSQYAYLEPETCPPASCNANTNFTTCFAMPGCAWCQFAENTGRGRCMEGTPTGPLNGSCNAPDMWHPFEPPRCQCNGHSFCNSTGQCTLCNHNTMGDHCETCDPGYFGNAGNGGNCTQCQKIFNGVACLECDHLKGHCTKCDQGRGGAACDECPSGFYGNALVNDCQLCNCSNQTPTCNSTTGVCLGCPPGVSGDHCETCYDGYVGDPTQLNGHCFFAMDANIRYQVTLPEGVQRYFLAKPVRDDTEINVTIIVNPDEDGSNETGVLVDVVVVDVQSGERVNLTIANEGNYSTVLEAKDYEFNDIVIEISVYTADYPVDTQQFQIYYTQYPPPFDLIKFFVIFFSCLAALFIMAGIAWKIRSNILRRRAARQRQAELVHMASRPFSAVTLLTAEPHQKPEPMSVEYKNDYKTSVSSILLLLPHHPEAKVHFYAIGSTISKLPENDPYAMEEMSKRNLKKRNCIVEGVKKLAGRQNGGSS